LHIRRESFKTFHEIALVLLANWPWGHFRTVKKFVNLLGSRWSEEEIEAAVWKIVGDAAAEGRLLVDLTKVELSLSTQLALLASGLPPILPDPLPSSLEVGEQGEGERSTSTSDDSNAPLEVGSVIPGPTIDTSEMEEEERKHFENKLTAATRVLSGERLRGLQMNMIWPRQRSPAWQNASRSSGRLLAFLTESIIVRCCCIRSSRS
jgi:hypothetical protein